MGKISSKIRIRKSVRNAYILILIAIIIGSLFTLYTSFNAENNKKFVKTNIYEYNNKFAYSCDVNLLENNYITNDDMFGANAYVTDLISNVPINMTYAYDASQSSDITYTYQIVGNLEANYSKDGNDQKIWKKTDILVPAKEETVSSNKLEINENIDLDLKEKIQTVKNFAQELSMQVQATYTVLLEVSTRTMIHGQEVVNVYSPDVVFEIGSKTTTVKTNTEDTEKPQVVSKMVDQSGEKAQIKTGVITCVIIIASAVLALLLAKTKNSNTIKNEYKIELNRILKGCEEKIVEVKEKVEVDGQNLVSVKEFEEIIKVSEELFKPILYWNNESKEESWFCVLGNNIIYRYVLKR